MTNVREIAYDTLLIYDKGEQINDLISKVLEKYSYLDKQDRSFLTRLTEGTIERCITIDYVLNLFSKVPDNKMKPPVRTILRMSVYQIMYMNSVPDSAACNEAVKLAKKRKLSNLSGYINGVLRNIARNKEQIRYPDEKTDRVRYMSVWYSCPEWIVRLLCEEYGDDCAKTVLENSVRVRPIIGRVNISRIGVDDLVNESPENIKADQIIPYAISLHNIDKVADIDSFARGEFVIQDIASMLVGHISGIKKTDTVIDVCAAPGGKSMHAADLASDGQVISCDVTEEKVMKINDNLTRCGFDNVIAKCMDALECHEELIEKGDVVIADVPCSGLGVMGRKNDIKYRLKPEQMEELPRLQRRIIDNVVSYVKPGGTFIYSTCTVHKAENIDNYMYIINEKGLEPVDFYSDLPDAVTDETAKNGYIQLFGKDGVSDGFFIAKFVKK